MGLDHTSDKDLYEQTVYSTEDSPSHRLLVKLWISWAVLDGIFGLFSFVVWLAIARSKRARSSPFNMYLLLLMLPDWFYNFNFCISSTMNAINGAYYGFKMCMWQSWYSVWGIGANAWLNALMAWEILKMLKSSRQLRRYRPPEIRQVCINGVVVYFLVGFFSALGSLELNSLYPLDTALHGSLTCGPKPFSKGQTLIVWLFFAPLFVLIPYVYVLFCVVYIFWNKLLPKRGKRRILSIYFFRIVAIFLVMWGPVAFLIYFFNEFIIETEKEHASIFSVAVWAHFQAVVSAAVTLTKPDVCQAVKNLLSCTPEVDKGSSELELPRFHPRRICWRITRRFSVLFYGRDYRVSEEDDTSLQCNADQNDQPKRSNNDRNWSDLPVQSADNFQFEDESTDAFAVGGETGSQRVSTDVGTDPASGAVRSTDGEADDEEAGGDEEVPSSSEG